MGRINEGMGTILFILSIDVNSCGDLVVSDHCTRLGDVTKLEPQP